MVSSTRRTSSVPSNGKIHNRNGSRRVHGEESESEFEVSEDEEEVHSDEDDSEPYDDDGREFNSCLLSIA